MPFPLPIPQPLRDAVPPGTAVLVAVSGGVDSAVAMALLRELGCDLHAVTFKNFCYSEAGVDDDRACCSAEAVERARAMAGCLDVPHRVTGVERIFSERVVAPFVDAYRRGLTPNPCVDCNAAVRFPHLLRLADLSGCALVATGHYARVEREGRPRLLRGVDPEKDQSYFLHRIGSEALGRCVFPLGWYVKEQVRAAAEALGLPAADRPESQEICFVPDDDRSFLFRDSDAVPGDIVDRGGRVLGRHRGLPFYTVGQRRGLGIAAARPLYVTAIEAAANRIRVGFAEELSAARVVADRFTVLDPDMPDSGPPPEGVSARIRHRHRGAPVAGWRLRGDRLIVELARPERAIAPGQALVLYRGDAVLGGGRIISADDER